MAEPQVGEAFSKVTVGKMRFQLLLGAPKRERQRMEVHFTAGGYGIEYEHGGCTFPVLLLAPMRE